MIALAGVAGLVVVIGGVAWLRSRSLPQDDSLLTPTTQTTPSESPLMATSTVMNARSTTSTGEVGEDSRSASQDADGDGLTDEEELRIGTSTTLRDTDGDGYIDYEEVRVMRTDPLFFNAPVTAPAPAPEPENLSPVTPSSALDSDSDGLTDQDEVRYQTNPSVADTDGDGYLDGAEIQKGYNPRGPGKCATPTCLP